MIKRFDSDQARFSEENEKEARNKRIAKIARNCQKIEIEDLLCRRWLNKIEKEWV